MNTTAKPFRFIGITDESTTCDHCGKEDLARTVMLATLDADGNAEGLVYFGTTCAGRALAARWGVKMTRTAIVNAAESAELERRAADRDARQLLGHYGLPLQGEATLAQLMNAADLYAHAHRHAAWANSGTDWAGMVRDMLTRRQAQVIV